MAWEGPETSPPFLRVPGPLFLKHVSLCPPPASMLVALTSTCMDVKFNALSTAPSCPVPESTWAKDLSLVTLLKIWGGSRGVCVGHVIAQGLRPSTSPFPPFPLPSVEEQAKFPSSFIQHSAALVQASAGSQLLPSAHRLSRFFL